MNQEVKYLGWTIYRWRPGCYGVWLPDGSNTGSQYTSLAKAKKHIKAVEEKCCMRERGTDKV